MLSHVYIFLSINVLQLWHKGRVIAVSTPHLTVFFGVEFELDLPSAAVYTSFWQEDGQ